MADRDTGWDTDRDEADAAAARRRERLRRAAELLGDHDLGRSRDDTDEGWGEPSGRGAAARGNDDELRRNVPPHHG